MTITADAPPALVLRDLLDSTPTTFALIDNSGRHTAHDVRAWTDQVTATLVQADVRPGERVIVQVGREATDVAAMIGAHTTGAAIVPVDDATPQARAEAMARNCGATLTLRYDPDSGPTVQRLSAPTGAAADAATAGAIVIYTSGSSGTPKGIVCPTSAVRFAVDAIQTCLDYHPTDVIAQPLPLTFDYGLYQVLLGLRIGATVRLYRAGTTGPAFFRHLARDGVTVLPSMPVLSDTLITMGTRRGAQLDQLRMVTSTGGPCTPDQRRGLRAIAPNADIIAMYGLTECKRATITRSGDNRHDGSGTALPGTTLKIVGADGAETVDGADGAIHVGGPHVMAGYWPLDDADLNQRFYTDATGTRWVSTGDVGHLDHAGSLHVTGRADDVFKANGYRTSVTEVEAALKRVGGVDQACVIPPTATSPYRAAYTGSRDVDTLWVELAAELERAKHPTELIRVEQIPTNPNGKLDRPATKTMLAERNRP